MLDSSGGVVVLTTFPPAEGENRRRERPVQAL